MSIAPSRCPSLQAEEGLQERGHRRRDPIASATLEAMASRMFGGLVKSVVDVQRGVMAVDGEMHADEEALMLGDGSLQRDLWGINLYPDQFGTVDFVEFDSVN